MAVSNCMVCDCCGKHEKRGDPLLLRSPLCLPVGWVVVVTEEAREDHAYCSLGCAMLADKRKRASL